MPGFGNTYTMVLKDDGMTVEAEVETALLQRFSLPFHHKASFVLNVNAIVSQVLFCNLFSGLV